MSEGENKVRNINLTCPICQTEKEIAVPEKVFAQKKFGSIKIQVPPGAVCPDHQFIVFLDPKGLIRGYEKIDILMKTQPEKAKAPIEGKIGLKRLINIFGLYGVFSLIHAKLFGYSGYIIRDNPQEGLEMQLNEFFDTITSNTYSESPEIQFIEETKYDDIKLKNNALLIDAHNNILQTPWEEKMEFEETIVKKALEIIDEEEQRVLLKQDINNLLKEVEHSVKILEDTKEIYDTELIDVLAKDLKAPKMSKARLNLIRKFIKMNISEDLAAKIKNKVQEFLNFL
jgi:hypothetical protein